MPPLRGEAASRVHCAPNLGRLGLASGTAGVGRGPQTPHAQTPTRGSEPGCVSCWQCPPSVAGRRPPARADLWASAPEGSQRPSGPWGAALLLPGFAPRPRGAGGCSGAPGSASPGLWAPFWALRPLPAPSIPEPWRWPGPRLEQGAAEALGSCQVVLGVGRPRAGRLALFICIPSCTWPAAYSLDLVLARRLEPGPTRFRALPASSPARRPVLRKPRSG